jgi:hypothetical protein
MRRVSDMKGIITASDAARLIEALFDASCKGRDIRVEIDDGGYVYVNSSHACWVNIEESE